MRQAGLYIKSISIDPVRYKDNATIMVLGHLTFGVFWLWPVFFANAPKAYLGFGLIDLSFGVVLGILLLRLRKEERDYARSE